MDEDLWEKERRLWLEGPEAYEELLADDALMTFPVPGGPMDRSTIIDSVTSSERWEAVALDDQHVREIGDARLLIYSAEGKREDKGYAAGCVSLWRMTEGGYRLSYHQQTPL
ncbi:nuclear transport factor 2 family protein [Pseudoroseicyclus tamaricis]|uniref:Nuclear transport factor 2 family protein n=1 Tax=Pseudoroseicyclus tamaricis TaxID=2705421 RepID=A0A6B2JUS8_9RHOB|nr:nuclear transport factor 2 family protein [Pseudoroseicyclus tamaricis]NDV00379.1 nuclear transport factor 2 family protein [Pseudoroseicyclus tamaricis]